MGNNYFKGKHYTWLVLFVTSLLFLNELKSQSTDTVGLNYYYTVGVPTVNKVWTGSDYVNAVNAIQKIAAVDLQKLPRKNSGNAKAIFSKIVDIEGYQLFDSTHYTLPIQFQFSADALKAVKSLLLLYYSKNGSSANIKYSNEVADCSIAMLFLLEKQLDITLSFFNDTSKLNETQRNGLKQAKRGLNTVISGMLMTIEKDYPHYERADIQNMAAYFFPYYKRLQKIIDASDIIEFNKRITAIGMDHEYKEIRVLANK